MIRTDPDEGPVSAADGREAVPAPVPAAGLAEAYARLEERNRALEALVARRTEELEAANAALRQFQATQDVLTRLSGTLRQISDPQVVQSTAAHVIGEQLDVDRVYDTDVDEPRRRLTVGPDYFRAGLGSFAGRRAMLDIPAFFEVLRRGEVFAAADVRACDAFPEAIRRLFADSGACAIVGKALVRRGRIVKLVVVISRAPRPWTPGEIAFVAEAAERTWRAIEQARSGQALTRLDAFHKALLEGIPQLVWRGSDEGHWTWSSPQWTRFTGMTAQASRGHGWLRAVHPGDRDRAQAAWHGARRGARLDMEVRIFSIDEQRYRWFRSRAEPVADVEEDAFEWMGTSTDIQELKEMQDRQEVLVGELQHRTRNLLGVVRALADRTIAASSSTEEFRDRFRRRLGALARVNGLLSRLEEGQRVAFDELVIAELSAQGVAVDEDDGRVTLDGPLGVRLRSATLQTFALALHELITNSGKYGALAVPDGRLGISWRVEGDRYAEARLKVSWEEHGILQDAAADEAAASSGYGRELIERALPYQLSARTTYALGPDGVRCTIDLPIAGPGPSADP